MPCTCTKTILDLGADHGPDCPQVTRIPITPGRMRAFVEGLWDEAVEAALPACYRCEGMGV